MYKLKLISVIATIAIVLSSCAASDDAAIENSTQPATGRYAEEQWQLPEGVIYSLYQQPDGKIGLFLYDAQHTPRLYSTLDGGEWEEESYVWFDHLYNGGNFVFAMDMNSSGNSALIYMKIDDDAIGIGLVKNGVFTEVPLDFDYSINTSSVVLSDNNDIKLTTKQDEVIIISETGVVTVLETTGQTSSFSNGRMAQIIATDQDTYTGIRLLETNNYTTDKTLECNFLTIQNGLAMSQQGDIAVVNSDGIFYLNHDGSLWEKLIDGSLTSLKKPLAAYDQVLLHGNYEILVLMFDMDGEHKLFNYKFDGDLLTTPSEELTIYTLRESRILEMAALEFRNQYPDIQINILNRADPDTGMTESDAVRAINTEVLAGKGPDLFWLYGMPIESYIEKGVLGDLSDLIEPLIDSGDLLPNIARTFRKDDGSIMAVPTHFSVPMVWGEPDAIAACKNLKSIADYAEEHKGEPLFYYNTPDMLIYQFYSTCEAAFRKNDAFDQAALEDFLVDIKRISESSATVWTADDDPDYLYEALYAAAKQTKLYCMDMCYFSALTEAHGVVSAMEDARIAPKDGEYGLDASELARHFALQPGLEDGTYWSFNTVGLNANGRNQELAKAFIACLLSLEVQQYELYSGFPVNTKAIDILASETYDDNYFFTREAGDLKFDYCWPPTEIFMKVSATFPDLKSYALVDNDLTEMIIEYSEPYFAGSASVEEVAGRIANEMQIRYMENF